MSDFEKNDVIAAHTQNTHVCVRQASSLEEVPFPSPFVFAILIFGAMGGHDLEDDEMGDACMCMLETYVHKASSRNIYLQCHQRSQR